MLCVGHPEILGMLGIFVCRCIPYRYRPTGDGKSMEVLMISSQRGEGLLFPKVRTTYLVYFLVSFLGSMLFGCSNAGLHNN